MSVDSVLVDSFVQLTNHFATFFSDTESISSMTDLWEKQGGFIAKLISVLRSVRRLIQKPLPKEISSKSASSTLCSSSFSARPLGIADKRPRKTCNRDRIQQHRSSRHVRLFRQTLFTRQR
ncbi:hypothetical protein CRE_23248 [Caenorhabditis remanei]|uniref:Uncharacterized protein n=1 Tax=Caenorhabditis remanei TaxID=31234 RepID=E3NRA8_CAERE|nr:hypothetical protein CRE_23248 [Caenorhabditis remanei]